MTDVIQTKLAENHAAEAAPSYETYVDGVRPDTDAGRCRRRRHRDGQPIMSRLRRVPIGDVVRTDRSSW